MAASHHVSYTRLTNGDCFNRDVTSVFADKVTKVPCAKSHNGEVVGSFTADNGAWPGPVGMQAIVGQRCDQAARRYTTSRPAEVGIYFLYPGRRAWDNGSRLVVCELHNRDGSRRSGSVAA